MAQTNGTPLPENWRDTLLCFGDSATRRAIAKRFEVSPSVVWRWQRVYPEFGTVLIALLKHARHKNPPKKVITVMTPDDIDSLLYDLLSEPCLWTTKQARIAIRQLRKEKRQVMSDANRIRHAAHIRTAGNGRAVHANGGAKVDLI